MLCLDHSISDEEGRIGLDMVAFFNIKNYGELVFRANSGMEDCPEPVV